MPHHSKLLIAALATALTLAMGVSTAAALRAISVTGSTTVTYTGNAIFDDGSGVTVLCDTTITRTVSRAIPKVEGTLLGKLTRWDLAATKPEPRCNASIGRLEAITILGIEREEVGRLFYRGFAGTLPIITAITKLISGIGYSFTINLTGECLYVEDGRRVAVRENLNAARELESAEIGANRFNLSRGGFFCPRTLQLRGSLRATTRTIFTLV